MKCSYHFICSTYIHIFQVGSAEEERISIALLDAFVARGYTKLINVDKKKAIIKYVNTVLKYLCHKMHANSAFTISL